ncbi:hypothetical protein [Streptomyces noursei]
MATFPVFLGLDVGKKRDRAAWVGLVPKGLGAGELPVWAVVVCEQAPVGTPYRVVAERSRDLAAAFAGGSWPVLIAVDATGVGASIVEELRRDAGNAEVLGVHAHSGKRVTGAWPDLGAPKRELVGALGAAMSRGGITVTSRLPAAEDLRLQLKDYAAKQRPDAGGARAAHVRFEAAHEKTHDDVVSAAQLAVWAGAYWWDVCRKLTPGRG